MELVGKYTKHFAGAIRFTIALELHRISGGEYRAVMVGNPIETREINTWSERELNKKWIAYCQSHVLAARPQRVSTHRAFGQ